MNWEPTATSTNRGNWPSFSRRCRASWNSGTAVPACRPKTCPKRRTMTEQATRVLLIEDNPGDADLVRLRLVESQPDVKVDCVGRLSDALLSLDREIPSLVLLDLNLPDSRGSETVRRVREKVPNVPVVVLSGQDDESLALKAVHQGVQDYLLKGDLSSKRLEHAMR